MVFCIQAQHIACLLIPFLCLGSVLRRFQPDQTGHRGKWQVGDLLLEIALKVSLPVNFSDLHQLWTCEINLRVNFQRISRLNSMLSTPVA